MFGEGSVEGGEGGGGTEGGQGKGLSGDSISRCSSYGSGSSSVCSGSLSGSYGGGRTGLGRVSWCENGVDASSERAWEEGRIGGGSGGGEREMTSDAGGGAVVLSNGLRLSARGGEGVGGGMGVIWGEGIRGEGRGGGGIKRETHYTNLLSLTCCVLRQPEYLYAKVNIQILITCVPL